MAVRRVGIGVRWPPQCEDLSPEAEKRPPLEDINKQKSEHGGRENCSLCIVICKVCSRVVC
jgi:hypothetical protein